MATAEHAAAVKSLNKSPGRRRFVFKSFSQQIDDIEINVFRSLDKVKAEPSEGSSFLRDCLIQWRELNTAEDFISFYEEIMPFVQTLPSIILHKELIFSKLISRLRFEARLSLEPILRLIAALSRDLLKDFLLFLPRIADSLVSLLESGADREPDIVEQIFTSWSFIMMYLQKYLIQDIISVLKITVKLRYYSKDYIQEFMAEATSFLLRNAPFKKLKAGIQKIMLEVVKKQSPARKSGVSALLYYVMRGTSSGVHSSAERVLKLLISQSVFSIGDKFNQGSDTIVEVLITAFQRICSNLGSKEFMWENLYREIIDSVDNRCLFHLGCLLSLLIATVEIDNDQGVSDYQPVLELVDVLKRVFITPSKNVKDVDHLFEVVDKVLQLMLCILNGLHGANDMDTITDCSSQWAPAFELKNSSSLKFIGKLLQLDPCVVYTFRVNILSAINDMIENSQDEVICLLLSFFDKLQMEPECCNFLDGVSEGRVLRIRGFLQEAVCSWISVINNVVAHGNSSSIEIDKAKLALLWGIVRCYPRIMDVQANSSLLMELIDALHRLSMDEAELFAGVSKHIWQSLIGASLSSYHELHCAKQSGLEETGKVLHLAKTCKSSSQVLCAVADYLDYVHRTILPADNSHGKYHPELEAEKVEDAVVIYADNLCHSDKAIRVSTLRILCHYEPLTYEDSTMDQPPEKKMKTETGVPHACPVDIHGCNVIHLLLSIEATPLSISTSRKLSLLISRIHMDLGAGRISETYIPLVLNGVLGIFHNRFSYLWNPASECLAVLISKHVGFVWNKLVRYFQHCQSIFQISQDELDKPSFKLPDKSADLVECFNLFVSPASDSTPHGTVLSLLLQSLQKIPSVVEAQSRQVIPLFLDFLAYNIDNLVSVRSFNSSICKGKEWKSVLKEWLNLLKLMRNPKTFYKSQFLKDVLQNRLLDENDAEIQMKVLDCLLVWKDDFLIPYHQHLRNLINSKSLREELTTWSLSRESHLIEDDHRSNLLPLVIRLLMPKVRKLKTLASRKHASIYHRKAVLCFVAQLDVDELPLFFALLIKSLEIIPKGTDDGAFWEKPYCNMEEFQEYSFLKFFTIENLASLSWKKSHGFLHVIEDVIRVFDELHVGPFLNLLIGCVVRVLASCTSSLDFLKGCGSSVVENHANTDSTLLAKDNLAGKNQGQISSAMKQLKDIRSLCLRILSTVLNKYVDHDYDCDFWDLFFQSVKPLIDAFKQEGSSSEKPSSLFSCFLAMSRSHRLVSLLEREENLIPDIFSILTVMTASEAIVSSVLKFIENLLNLDNEVDGEYSAIKKVLLPNVATLISSLHFLFQCAAKRKLVNGETVIRILQLLSQYIKDPLEAGKFLDILLPFLAKGVKDSEVVVKVLHVLRDIIPVAGTGSTKKVLNALSPLLAYVELDMRSSICDLLDSLAKADPSVFPVAKLVSELNATSAVEMGGLDYDSIVTAYDKIGIDLFHTIEVDHSLVILSHCVRDMSSDEMILRHSAYRSLLSFVEFSSLILNRERCNTREVMQAVDDGLWTIGSIQRIINKFILKRMGEAMTRGSSVKKEWVDLLREMVLKLPQLSNLNSLKDLCSGDTEVDFFNNIIHLQKHRRARALTRFRKVVSASNTSEGLVNKVFVPLFFNMLFDVQDENVRSACSEALASISAHMKWKSYSALLMRCFQEMEKNPQKQKILLRLFCSILDEFHFSQLCSSQEANDPSTNALDANLDNNSSSIILQNCHNSMTITEIKTCLNDTMLPKLQKLLYADSEKANVDISRAVLKVLKLLPGDIMDSQLPSIIHRISNFLKSRSDGIRNSARIALADCLKELGLEYLQFIVRVLRSILKRGYELHVMGYTLNFILSKSLSRSTSCKLDYCLEELLSVAGNDILGDVAEQKEVEKIASKMIETRKQKSFETLELIAQNITFRSHASKLLSVVTAHLQNHLTPKVKSKLESMLNHIAAGIERNPSVDQTDLFVFIYDLVQKRIEEENDLHANSSSKGANNYKNDVRGKTISSGRVIVAKSTCSHLITVFALGLLHKRLKNLKLKKHDEELLSKLDSFMTILGNCLSSKYEDILSASLRCLAPLISLPLPSLKSQADKMKATLLDIAHSSATSSSLLMQSCLNLLTKLLRTTDITLSSDQLHELIQFPLFVDLERNPSDLALSLLKAIVNRKLVVPEIYDVVIQVAELMVTSQEESIRKKCSHILLQFLLDYQLSDKRLQQHLDFLLANLSYKHPSGREAVLEMLHVIIKKFPQTKLDEQSNTLFLHLVFRLVNDPDNTVRLMIGVALKLLVGRISSHSLYSILEYSLSWYLDGMQQLQSAGAQVLGLLVEVMKKDFQEHIDIVLQEAISILQSTKNIVEQQLDLPDETTIPFWKDAYYSLVLLEKILCHFPDILLDTRLENLWEAICELLLHPHTWLRNISNRLIAMYFAAVTEARREDGEKSFGDFFLIKPSRVFMIAVSLCCQLETQDSFEDAFSNHITENLVSAICNMHSFRGYMECADFQNFWSNLGQHEQGLFLRAFQLLDLRKGRGLFLSIISGAGDQNDCLASGDFQYLLVSNLLKKMGKIALQKDATIQMKIIFNTFRLISSKISQDYLQRYVVHMLPSLYKVCEGFAGKNIPDDLKQLAKEVSDSIRDTLGGQIFVQVYNEIRKNLKAKRDKRKQEDKRMAVVNPMRNAKRKLRVAAKHRANKKRKIMTMGMGRWLR